MRNSIIFNLISFLFVYPLFINSASGKHISHQFISSQIEEKLNQKKHELLKDLFLQKSFNDFNKQYQDFTKKYKNAKWSIKTKETYQNKKILEVEITSIREIGGQNFDLNSKQEVEIEIYKNKIKSYTVLNDESILNSQNNPLIVKINSPNKVLTGERYEVNLIIQKPLDDSLIASGIIVLKNNTYISQDFFSIIPSQSGGLFKYIQAPLKPGFQTISAIITHPQGIYSITKKIKVGL